jgi:hypothetical protein
VRVLEDKGDVVEVADAAGRALDAIRVRVA